MSTSDDIYLQTFEIGYFMHWQPSEIDRMPLWEIRKYHNLLIEQKKDENEAQKAANEGRPHMRREKLRPPLSQNEAHGDASSTPGNTGPPQLRNRVQNEAELAARRRDRIEALQKAKDASRSAQRQARQLGVPLSFGRDGLRPIGTHGMSPDKITNSAGGVSGAAGAAREPAAQHFGMRPRHSKTRLPMRQAAAAGELPLPAREAAALPVLHTDAGQLPFKVQQRQGAEPPAVKPAAPTDPTQQIIKTVASPKRRRLRRGPADGG